MGFLNIFYVILYFVLGKKTNNFAEELINNINSASIFNTVLFNSRLSLNPVSRF